MPVEEQVAIIFASTNGFLDPIPLNKVPEYENQYLTLLREKYEDLLKRIKKGEWNDEITDTLKKVAQEVLDTFI